LILHCPFFCHLTCRVQDAGALTALRSLSVQGNPFTLAAYVTANSRIRWPCWIINPSLCRHRAWVVRSLPSLQILDDVPINAEVCLRGYVSF
jgi:hypothetical protein